jgi:hypothetical protein
MEGSGLDNRRRWAGFLLSFGYPFALLPPEGSAAANWLLPPEMSRSHRDERRLHITLHVTALADPEPLDRILVIDLGRFEITPWGRTTGPSSGDNVVDIINGVTSNRMDLVCLPCYKLHQQEGSLPCSCTHRKRFLDRWDCFLCHVEENKRLDEQTSTDGSASRWAIYPLLRMPMR